MTQINSLMFGGYNFIVVESIWVTKTHQNYRYVILALSYLDSMTNGQEIEEKDEHDKAIEILYNLAENAANGMLKNIKIDNFMLSTFQCFIENKKEIKLCCRMLERTNKRIRDTIMYQMVEYKSKITKFTRLKETDFTNLFRPELFKIFINAKSLILKVRTGVAYHPFSFLALLKVIKVCALEKVVIKVFHFFFRGKWKSWIQQLWLKSRNILKESYNAANYSINFEIIKSNEVAATTRFVIQKR